MSGSMPRYSKLFLLFLMVQLMAACSYLQLPQETRKKYDYKVVESPVPKVTMTPLKSVPKSSKKTLYQVAKTLGMAVKIDMKNGHRRLSKGQDVIVIVPGQSVAFVNGHKQTMPGPVTWNNGVLIAPDKLDVDLASALRRHPPQIKAITWKPVSMPKPKATPKAKAWSNPSVPPLPHGWDMKANRRWDSIVIHHSATGMGGARSFHRSHKRKWRWGLGYHFVVGNGTETKLGEVEVGLRWRLQNKGVHGAHAGVGKYNRHGIGICLVGDFRKKAPQAKQLAALVKLCRTLMKRYKIKASNVLPHRHVRRGGTECPGKAFPWARFKELLGS